MKFALLNLILLLATAPLFAQNEYLTVRNKDGQETSVKVAVGTVLTFKNGALQTTTNGQTTEFPLSSMQAFFFSATPTGIQQIGNEAMVTLNANAITVNAPAHTRVAVTTMDGRQVYAFTKLKNGSETRTISLPNGIYVVSVGTASKKVLVP